MWGSEEVGKAPQAALQSNLAPLHFGRLGALDSRWRPGAPQGRACATRSTCSGEGGVAAVSVTAVSKELFLSLCTYREEGRKAPSGEEPLRQASLSLGRAAGDAARCDRRRDPCNWAPTEPPPRDRRSELLAVEENRNRTPNTFELAKGRN